MARPRTSRALRVWMNNLEVGQWTIASSGEHAFAYTPTWLERPEARPLSLSMPLQATTAYRGALVEDWFDNLLPDSREIRQRIQRHFSAASTHAFGLLSEIGRDCVGAVQLLPPDTLPQGINRIEGERLSESEVARILRALTSSGGVENDLEFRISLAGVQEKTALLWHQGQWHRPLGTTPTTHIFKIPITRIGTFQGDLSGSVENEWLCGRILEAYGLPVAGSRIATFEDQKALVVDRFDRRLSADGTYWMRLPQEDVCQALGLASSSKYESDGGPGIRTTMDLLLGSTSAEDDRRQFLKTLVLFWMLCATDGHAKNFSLAIHPQGRFALTPLYDVISVWPMIGRGAGRMSEEKAKMAMAAISRNRHYRWSEILPRHWLSTARACGMDELTMQSVIDELVERTPQAVASIRAQLPANFPEAICEPIFRGLERSTERLAR